MVNGVHGGILPAAARQVAEAPKDQASASGWLPTSDRRTLRALKASVDPN